MSALELPAADLLHVAQSRFLDGFAAVEGAIGKRLAGSTVSLSGPMGQRIEALRAIKPSPAYSKAMRDKLHLVLDRLSVINAVRCDIAHGRLHPVRVDREYQACFVNPLHATELGTPSRLLSVAQLEGLTAELQGLAAGIAPSD